MSIVNFDALWTLMSKYTFESESLNEDVRCVICNKIVIDAHQSICGCKYCHRCINEYLCGKNKHCPGNKAGCKEEQMALGTNVFRNKIVNIKISKVKVHCPNEFCQFTEELIKMKDHLRTCVKPINDCPYNILGCDNKGGSKDRVLDHMQKHAWQHTLLLIDYIQNKKNEDNILKEDLEKCKLKIDSLKEDSREKEEKIKDILEEIRMKKIELENEKKQSWTIKNEVKTLKTEYTKYKEETKSKMDTLKEESDKREVKIKDMLEEITKTKKELEDEKKQSRIMKDDGKTLKMEFIKIRRESQSKINLMERESKAEKEMDNNNIHILEEKSKNEIDILKETIDRMEVWSRLVNMVGEAVFSVDRFSVRRTCEGMILSPYFYSHANGYKLRLAVYPGGEGDGKGSHLSVYSVISKGEYDDELSWPCKHSIKISVVNQTNGRDHISGTLGHSSAHGQSKNYFDKPIKRDNLSLGFSSFIAHSALCTAGLCVNDVIVIRCNVEAPL